VAKLEFASLLKTLSIYLELERLNDNALCVRNRQQSIIKWIREHRDEYNEYSQIACDNMLREHARGNLCRMFDRWVFLLIGPECLSPDAALSESDKAELLKVRNQQFKK
jgi:hypothetical protein